MHRPEEPVLDEPVNASESPKRVASDSIELGEATEKLVLPVPLLLPYGILGRTIAGFTVGVSRSVRKGAIACVPLACDWNAFP